MSGDNDDNNNNNNQRDALAELNEHTERLRRAIEADRDVSRSSDARVLKFPLDKHSDQPGTDEWS